MDNEIIDGSKTVTLKYPLRFGESELIETVTIKPPKGKHLKGIQVGIVPTHDQWLNLISKCSETPLAALDEMEAMDTFKIIEVMSDFLELGPKIGKN